MDANENIRQDTPDDVIVLGVASIETRGGPNNSEPFGGGTAAPGISED
jgi:hypothetical protein